MYAIGRLSLRWQLLVLCCFLIGACREEARLVGEREVLLRQDIVSLAWPNPSSLVISIRKDADDPGEPATLWQFDLDSDRLLKLNLGSSGRCSKTDFFALTRLSKHEIAFLRDCALRARALRHRTIEAFDLRSMTARRLVERPVDVSAGQMTWNEDLERGFYGEFPHSPCVELFELTPDVAKRADITISDGAESWNTNEGGPNREFMCTGLGSASLPAWSHDGRTLAFFATPLPPEGSGIGRLDAEWSLYFAAADDLRPSPVIENVREPLSLAWSADDDLLAFSGEVDGRLGTWLYDRRTNQVSYLDDAIGGVDWSPNESALVIGDGSGGDDKDELLYLKLDGSGE